MVSSDKAGGLYRSDDGGATWSLVNDDDGLHQLLRQPRHGRAGRSGRRLSRRPVDPPLRPGRRDRCEIVKGAPGGDDYHFVWINPEHPDHMATASDQGVVVTVDAGRTWSSWYNQPTGQFYHLAADDRFP